MLVPITQNQKPILPPPPVQDLTPVDGAIAHDRASRELSIFGHTPLSAAFRFVSPTWRNYIMYVDLEARTGNLDAARYLKLWQSLPVKERASHFPEQICDLANVPSADLVRWVAGQAWAEGSAKANICMSFLRDRVLEKSAEFAMASPDNYKHTDLFMRASGLLAPSNGRSGPAVTIFNAPVASSSSVALADSKSESAPVDRSGLRDMDSEIVELSRVMQTGDTHARAEDLEDEEEDDGPED